jgi:hypothetical protein
MSGIHNGIPTIKSKNSLNLYNLDVWHPIILSVVINITYTQSNTTFLIKNFHITQATVM